MAGEQFVLCVSNDGYPASLEARKVYRALPDATARRLGMLRVVDESGEDYLFPAEQFVALRLPVEARAAFRAPRPRTSARRTRR